MIVGDSAGFLNSARLKGIHLAIKSGMLAAETAFEALVKSDSSSRTLGKLTRRVETSWIKDELWPVRNFHQGFENGMIAGMLNTGLQEIFDGGLRNRVPSHPGHERMKPLAKLPPDGGPEAHVLGPLRAMVSLLSTNLPICITRARNMKRISRRISSSTTPTFA